MIDSACRSEFDDRWISKDDSLTGPGPPTFYFLMTTGFRCMMDSAWAADPNSMATGFRWRIDQAVDDPQPWHRRRDKQNDSETAVKCELYFQRRNIWFPAHRGRDAGCGKVQMFRFARSATALCARLVSGTVIL